MTKAELRTECRQKRALLTPEVVSTLSQQLTDGFFADQNIQQALAFPQAVLHTFLPIRRQNEVDTWPIIQYVWAEFPHVRVLSSVTDFITKTMTSFDLEPDTALVENRWGILEPVNPFKPVSQLPTLVLVPLLTFDRTGHRVGYGAGCYDRFLAELESQYLGIGLSLLEPAETIDDPEPTDVVLNGCVCPDYVYWMSVD